MSWDCINVYITCKDNTEADAIAKALIEDRLAACVQNSGKINSVYRWKNEIVNDEEVLLTAKTVKAVFDELCRKVKQLHSYETPEIISCDISAASPDYIEWLKNQVK